jgi:DNA polymerase-3 subunit epsilon
MRQLLLDTETTGLDPKQGHRIIEIAAVEVVDRRLTGAHLDFRLDPERDIDAGATEVHGMTREDLAGSPRFSDIASEFVKFARGAEWIIHNAPFDIAFFDAEFSRAGLPPSASLYAKLTDTLALAREAFPGKRNNLDALCERFGVSNTHRTLHGALLDAELLARVYLAMTRGQAALTIDIAAPASAPAELLPGAMAGAESAAAPIRVHPVGVPEADAQRHRAYLEALARESRGGCMWLELEAEVNG